MRPIQVEERLIQFAIDAILVGKKIDHSLASEHSTKQLIKSATSAALNYDEAQGGESVGDFLHKLKICLKKLWECLINMKIQKDANRISDIEPLDKLFRENTELISIVVARIKTASSIKSTWINAKNQHLSIINQQ